MPIPELLLLALWSAVAAVAQSVSGFGFGVVLVAVLPLFGIRNGGGHEGAIGFRLPRKEISDLGAYVADLISGINEATSRS